MGRTVGHFGPVGAVLPTLTPILGSLWAKTVIWPYLRPYLILNRDSEGSFIRPDPPLFVVSTP